MISDKLQVFNSYKGALSANLWVYDTAMDLVFDKKHYIYGLEETGKDILYNRLPTKKGLDMTKYFLAGFSWRHELLIRVGECFETNN